MEIDYISRMKKLTKAELVLELEHLYNFLIESSEIASGAILRLTGPVSEARRLEIINEDAEKHLKRIFKRLE